LLVLRVQRGEVDLAGLLYERYFDRVYAYLRAGLSSADAEDAAQQVFTNALAALSDFDIDGASPFRGWLFVIAHNTLCRFRERQARVRLLPPTEVARRIERDHSVPDPAERLRDWTLKVAVAKLPEAQRQVLLLRFLGDLTPAEIAEVLQISEGAVHQRQHRALEILQRRFISLSPSGRVVRAPMRRRDRISPALHARRMALIPSY
jgi:RNA polymerase sigma-70 factor (ECF subfamily)